MPGNWGGRRPNSGRKAGIPNKVHRVRELIEDSSKEVLKSVDVVGLWRQLLASKQPKIVLDALIYLHDRAYGKPVQMVAGDPNKPISIQLAWGSTPEWMQVTEIQQDTIHLVTEGSKTEPLPGSTDN